jgi:hypothetical protein
MKYKIYQISTFNGYNNLPKNIDRKDVSNTHYITPNGEIVDKKTNWIMDKRYFEIEVLEV